MSRQNSQLCINFFLREYRLYLCVCAWQTSFNWRQITLGFIICCNFEPPYLREQTYSWTLLSYPLPGCGLALAFRALAWVDSSQLSPGSAVPLLTLSPLSLRVIPPLQLGEQRDSRQWPGATNGSICRALSTAGPGLSFMHNSADVGPQR